MLAATTHIGSENSEITMEPYVFKKRVRGAFLRVLIYVYVLTPSFYLEPVPIDVIFIRIRMLNGRPDIFIEVVSFSSLVRFSSLLDFQVC